MPAWTATDLSPLTSDISALIERATGHWVLDRLASSAAFEVNHFWGATTVRGRFERISGEGTVGGDGSVSGVGW